MDWTQTLTIIATLLGVTAWLDHKHRQEMDKMDENRRLDIANHREDMKAMDERWKWLDSTHRQEMDERMDKMDERWKWLFERIETKLDQIKVKL